MILYLFFMNYRYHNNKSCSFNAWTTSDIRIEDVSLLKNIITCPGKYCVQELIISFQRTATRQTNKK